jgi:hypothetical protein
MTRECHVRICERLGVKFPGPTRRWPLVWAADWVEHRESGTIRVAMTYRLCFPPRFETVSCVPGACFVSSGLSPDDGPSADPRVLIVGEAGEQSAQLNRRGQFTTLLVRGADRGGISFTDEHLRQNADAPQARQAQQSAQQSGAVIGDCGPLSRSLPDGAGCAVSTCSSGGGIAPRGSLSSRQNVPGHARLIYTILRGNA